MTIRRVLFWAYYVFFLLLSLFTILVPRPLLMRMYAPVWSWVLLVPVARWFVGYVRALYRGDE